MFHIPRHDGVPDNDCKEISVLYCGTKSSVLADGEMSGEFEIKVGVLQGNILPPFLLLTLLYWGFTMVPRWSQRYPAEKVRYFDFTDDIVELEESLQ